MKKAPLWKILSYTLPSILVTFNFFISEDILYALDLISIVGEGNLKSTLFGIGVSLATLSALIVGYFSGVIMDKTGLSYFLIAFGLMSTSIFLLLRPLLLHFLTSSNTTIILISYFILLIFGKSCLAIFVQPHMSMMQYFFPKSQFGTVGGLIGFSNMSGALIGLGVIGLLFGFLGSMWTVIGMTIFNLLGLLLLLPAFLHFWFKQNKQDSIEEMELTHNVVSIQESTPLKASKASFFQRMINLVHQFLGPLRHRNFLLVSLMSFFTEMGFILTVKFQIYYFNDMVGDHLGTSYNLWIPFLNSVIDAPEKANALFGASVTIPSLFGALLSGPLSDRFGKKAYYLLIACYLFPIFKIVDVFFHNLNVSIILGVLQGFFVGVYFALEMAIMQEYLPDKENAGRDTAVFSLFKQSPQFLGTFLGGLIISIGNAYIPFMDFGGYVSLYFISALFHLAAFVCILFTN